MIILGVDAITRWRQRYAITCISGQLTCHLFYAQRPRESYYYLPTRPTLSYKLIIGCFKVKSLG